MTWPARYVYVLAIEGVDTLLTNHGDANAVAAAWAGTDWAATTPTLGLYVDLDQKQSGNPWEPFQPGGTLTATIADDNIGILTHRTAGGAETELTASLDQDDTTITVRDTSSSPESGTVHIGTECIAYTGTTSTTFTGCTRGKFSPFGTGKLGATRYAHNHRVGVTSYGPPLSPKVTQYPRTWIGRWVGLWVHAVNADGSLASKSSAQRVFAGRLVEVRDDADLLSTIFVAEHVLTDLREATIGRDMIEGEIADGVYIPASGTGGQTEFTWRDLSNGSWRTANPLVVVASGATGTNQMNEGFYSHDQLFAVLNTWLAGELSAGRLWGTYTLGIATTQNTPDSLRTKVYWRVPGSGTSTVAFRGTMAKVVALFLGFSGDDTSDALGTASIGDSDTANTTHHFYRDWVPLRSWVTTGLSTAFMRVENASGAFQDQWASMPAQAQLGISAPAGLFLFNDSVLVSAEVTDNLDGTLDLSKVRVALISVTDPQNTQNALQAFVKRLDDPTPTKIRQVFMFEASFGTFLNRLVYSGGTTDYNHASYDVLPYGCGLGYPGEIFGAAWETSIANMPGADKVIAPLLDKPTKISTLLGSDLVLRHGFPVWKSGGLRMATWQTPTTSLAVASLTEDNKAEPSGRTVNHRSPTLLSGRWAKNIIKIEYSRDAIGGEYKGTINIEDRTAIDDVGDRGEPFTIEARNTYASLAATGAGIEELVPTAFIPAVRLFTRALRTLKRSLDLTLWDLAPGDIVTVFDKFARDPTTGIRVLSGRPGTVISHRCSPGGAQPFAGEGSPPEPAPIVGEVELMFIETNRIYAYAPSALVDSAANTGGFTAGYNSSTKTIRCVAHAYSESSEPADAARFAVGDYVLVHEIDPADPATVQSWNANVVAVLGNDVTLDASLTSFSSSKLYRLDYNTYEETTAQQHEHAFQADDATGLVFEGTAQPYQFGLATSTIDATASSHTDLPERHAELTYGDGVAYDVGSLVGFARLVDNLIDHKTAIQAPQLSNAVLSNTTNPTGYKLVSVSPVYLTGAMLSNSIVRYLKVAPWFRSSDGTLTSIRVSLCAVRPNDDTLNDLDRGTPLAEVTWSTSSTTWQAPAPQTLTANVKGEMLLAWLVIECGYKCETRRLAECTEQERTVF